LRRIFTGFPLRSPRVCTVKPFSADAIVFYIIAQLHGDVNSVSADFCAAGQALHKSPRASLEFLYVNWRKRDVEIPWVLCYTIKQLVGEARKYAKRSYDYL